MTNALENMKKKGVRFRTGKVSEWLDCGNKDATVYTNGRVLEMNKGKKLVSSDVKLTNAVIVEPCFIGENVEIISSVIGPYVSLGSGSKIENSVVRDSIVGEKSKIKNSVLENSMIGNHAEYMNASGQLSLSDYSTHK